MHRLFSAQRSPPPLVWWAHNMRCPGISIAHAAQRLIALPRVLAGEHDGHWVLGRRAERPAKRNILHTNYQG